MKKLLLGFMAGLLAISLCACGAKTDVSNQPADSTTVESAGGTSADHEETVSDKTEETKKPAEDTTKTEVSGDIAGSLPSDSEKDDPAASEVQGDTTYPGKDVVEIVNLRGDETTVYKLADGRYMDRIERVFTYDGVETWTDEDGVEWNEVVK
ncbi:MAG: hypothetical protein ACI4D7_05090 [Lachnospiraceae bacterium]